MCAIKLLSHKILMNTETEIVKKIKNCGPAKGKTIKTGRTDRKGSGVGARETFFKQQSKRNEN